MGEILIFIKGSTALRRLLKRIARFQVVMLKIVAQADVQALNPSG
jgi:hypothetical protein